MILIKCVYEKAVSHHWYFCSHWLVLSGLELLLDYAQLRITSRCQFVLNYYLLVDVWALNGLMYLDRLFKTCDMRQYIGFWLYLDFVRTNDS